MVDQRRGSHTLLCLFAVAMIVATGLLLQRPQMTEAAQTPASVVQPPREELEDFMKSKLAALNAAMESASTDDYVAVERAGKDLIQLSKQASWKRRASGPYTQDTADFVQAAEFMVRMAQAQDSQGVASSYGAVAACCLNCHRHVRAPLVAVTDPADAPAGVAALPTFLSRN